MGVITVGLPRLQGSSYGRGNGVPQRLTAAQAAVGVVAGCVGAVVAFASLPADGRSAAVSFERIALIALALAAIAATVAFVWVGLRDNERHWRSAVDQAVVAERARLARELHDGIAQDLAYLRAQARGGDGMRVAAAVQRSLDEARLHIAALRRPFDEPLERSVERAAASAAARAGVTVEVVAAPVPDPSDRVREALVRIVSEAVGNAARHGGVKDVRVALRRLGDALVLLVDDDGVGFDPAAPMRPDALGLTSMRERAEGLGGECTVLSQPGAGTRVRVVVR